MSNYRYIPDRYRGRGKRYTSPQCGRKYTFTRYIDTENNNIYISENVGKCNRLDKWVVTTHQESILLITLRRGIWKIGNT